MANRTLEMTDQLHAYLMRESVHEPAVLARLREETSAMTQARMQIGPEQGAFMAWLVRLIGARNAIEVGTFTGYSAIRVASALPPGGRLVCCDVSEEFTSVARRYFVEAGLQDRIQLVLAPATQTLAGLLGEGEAGRFDFAFIDADKTNYATYYEQCLELVRVGGVVAIDNALWGGAVADPSIDDESTRAIRDLNAKVGRDPRVEATLVSIGDGILLCRKL